MDKNVPNTFKTRILLTLLAASLSISGCSINKQIPPPVYAPYSGQLPCSDRIGRCFDATIGGQPVVAIADKARHEQLTRMARESNDRVRDIFWEVVEPVDSVRALEVVVDSNPLGLQYVGEPKDDPDLMIYPLDNQTLQSESTLVEQSNVRIAGQPVVTQQNTLTQNHLPAGSYVIEIRYSGQNTWDRKRVLVSVK